MKLNNSISTIGVLAVIIFIGAIVGSMADKAFAFAEKESYIISSYNVSESDLVTFKQESIMILPPLSLLTTPVKENKEELERTLEVQIEKDGELQNIRFEKLDIQPGQVEEVTLRMDEGDDINRATATIIIPSEDAIYE